MIGRTLFFYLARVFAKWILGIFLLGAAIILLADFVESTRRAFDLAGFSPGTAFLASLLRTPSLAEEFLPFAVLFGAIGAFLALNRQLELVVMRAAGVSVWQLLLPPLVVGCAIGIVATTLYNPIAAWGRDRAEVLASRMMGSEERILSGTTSHIWFRQRGPEGPSIVSARTASPSGATLYDVVAYVFGRSGNFLDRIDAPIAVLRPGHWEVRAAFVFDSRGTRTFHDRYELGTSLTPQEVQSTISRPSAISFWKLPEVVALADRAGIPSDRYRLHLQMLLARPLLLSAMVVLAATVSLRLVRLGGTARAAAGGVLAGFMLYVGTKVAGDLGSAGLIAPTVAAWSPGIAALLFGATSLLRSEDG